MAQPDVRNMRYIYRCNEERGQGALAHPNKENNWENKEQNGAFCGMVIHKNKTKFISLGAEFFGPP